MSQTNDISEKASFFEGHVVEAFGFLEHDFDMHRGNVRILNRKDPRDVTTKIRYESESHRFDIAWGIGEDSVGILIWSKSCKDSLSSPNDKCYVYFEPFIEFLTNGADMPIVPQVYPNMSVSKIQKVLDERKQLFRTPLPDILRRLAEKLDDHIDLIISKNIATFVEFHEWMSRHR